MTAETEVTCRHMAQRHAGTAELGCTVCMDCHQVVERWDYRDNHTNRDKV